MSQLKIYKASAGSGKTFKLTEEYLKLLFKNSDNYKKTLAVTFTNKATDEMKRRIISELFKLYKQEPSPYIEILKSTTSSTPQQISEKAFVILQKILHNYSSFSVSTIDSFFQKVIRSFARETGLQAGFNIELDIDKVLNESIDKLLLDIGKNAKLTNWLIRFAEDKVGDGKTWDFKKDIKNLAKELFKENFKVFSNEINANLSNKDFLDDFYNQLKQHKLGFERKMKEYGDEGINLIKNNGLLIEDFKNGKTGFANYFNKIRRSNDDYEPGKRAYAAVDCIDEWYSKTSLKKEQIEDVYHAGLNGLLSETIDYYTKNIINYNTSSHILINFHSFGILMDLIQKINDYRENNNAFLISDLAVFLKAIIADNDIPFIYEKIGNTFKHYMIDEFQDTSSFQWDNFKPLINNSLSENNNSLVVGDIKQSIYRWRNGDWKLLLEQIEKDIKQFGVDKIDLDTNWRSKENVVEFNNSVFKATSAFLQNEYNNVIADISDIELRNDISAKYNNIINTAYANVKQSFPEKKEGGYINISFVENDNRKWKEVVKDRLPKIIEDLQDNEYRLRDIAILVRSKKDGKEIADYLLKYKNNKNAVEKYKYDVISSESLYLSNASSVRFIICVLNYLNNPSDMLNKADLIHEYVHYIQNKSDIDLHEIFNVSAKDNDIINKFLPEEFILSKNYIKKLPLYELIEMLIKMFSLNDLKGEYSYMEAFQDVVINFTRTKGSDITSFLEWWNETGKESSISMSEQQNAIRIMTIHQSKGLQFKAVIIPYLDWEIDNNPLKNNLLWCKTDIEPFNKIKYIPVNYSKNLINTIFTKEYFDEKLHAYIDNLNLLYVAFTRAEDILYSFPAKPKEPTKSEEKIKKIAEVLYKVFSDKNSTYTSKYWDKEKNSFIIGEFPVKDTSETKEKEDIGQVSLENYIVNKWRKRLSIRKHSKDFFIKQNPVIEEKINLGILMHEILGKIDTVDDIDRAVNKFVFQGKLSEVQSKSIKKELINVINIPKVKDWFQKGWIVKKECQILLPSGKILIPDRVMIKDNCVVVVDFKFGEEKSNEHIQQVKTYIDCLKQMGYLKLEAYVWYVSNKELIEVN